MRAREYEPVTGQFLQVDPAVNVTHEPYAYVAGDPLASVDPLGLCKGMDGTPQDRVCTANDFFWAGLPGEMNKQFKIAWAGFSAGSTLGIGLVTNNDVDCYGANPEFWVEFGLGALVTAATSVLSGAVTAEAEVGGLTAASTSAEVLESPAALEGLAVSQIDDLAINAGYDVLPGRFGAANPAIRYYAPGTNHSVGLRVLPEGVVGQSGVKGGAYLKFFGGGNDGIRIPLEGP
ncbi:MAG: hypothetical protein KF801_06400 [Cryobacterium sp.]|nr:hypothetical protein [Cryobacterium sp.]